MPLAYYIRNHTSSALQAAEFSDIVKLPRRPDNFLTKKDFLDWSHNPGTDHCYYNLVEPRDPTQRCTKENPAAFLHGIVADFDVANLEGSALARAITDCPADFPVAYVSRTYSRGIRMVWLFERKVPVFAPEIFKAIVSRLKKEMKLAKLAPGLDEGALADPARYFELGDEWQAVNPAARIASAILTQCAFDASAKANWKKEGRSIPIETVAAEVERRWPGRWKGPFAVGVQGIRFWDPAANNPKGAWIRETGVQAFTGEGRFLHWDEILGKDFVSKFDADRISQAVDDAWYDGKSYWIRNGEGYWVAYNAESMRRRFTCAGLNGEKQRGAPSEVDRALNFVDFERRLDGTFPFLYSDRETISMDGHTYLNISRVRALAPAEGPRAWGEGFDWLAKYLTGLFGEQLPVFLSWLSYAYQGALQHKARQGHALFLVGPQGAGKTLLSTKVIGGILGGFSEATDYILGKEAFNGNMFLSPVWSVDDAQIAADRRNHNTYSQLVKKVVANPSLVYRRMYSDGRTLPWRGRLVVTLNLDAISMLPNVEATLLDKCLFLLATDPGVSFAGVEAKIAQELPNFAAYLRGYEIPANLRGNERFGLKEYHHPELLAEARADAPSAEIEELIQRWRVEYFRAEEGDSWEGTATDLMAELNGTGNLRELVRQAVRSTSHLSRAAGQIESHGAGWLQRRRTTEARLIKILKP